MLFFLFISCSSIDEMHRRIVSGMPVYFTNGIFVSVTGNDSNPGTDRFNPLKNVQTAITRAISTGLRDIYITRGLFTPANGLNTTGSGAVITNNGLYLHGGCDLDFKVGSSDYSVFDGVTIVNHVIELRYVSDVALEHIVVCNGKADGGFPDNCGAGVNIFYSTNISLDGLIISNGYATDDGGGVFVYRSRTVSMEGNSVCNNRADIAGGGLAALQSEDITLHDSIINSNSSGMCGGGCQIEYCVSADLMNDQIVNNCANGTGGSAMAIYYFQPNCLKISVRNCGMLNNAGDNVVLVMPVSFEPMTNLIISNCLIAGTNHLSGSGIRFCLSGNLAYGHIFAANIFSTNSMLFLYKDDVGQSIACDAGWTNINDTNWTYASVSSGNLVTNLE